MKRSPMPPRTAPMARTPLTRTRGFEQRGGPGRYSSLERGGPIRPVSARRAAENRERTKVIAVLFPAYEPPPLCACGCGLPADDVHEILSRARGGSITDPPNLAPVARTCHGEITDEAPWGYEKNLSRHSWQGPPPPAIDAGPIDGLRGPLIGGLGGSRRPQALHARTGDERDDRRHDQRPTPAVPRAVRLPPRHRRRP